MKRWQLLVASILILFLSACNLTPASAPGDGQQRASGAGPATGYGEVASTLAPIQLPAQFTRFPPPPILPVPKTSLHIGTEIFDAYQVPENRLRLVCKQPCELDDRMIDALYAGYRVTVAQDIRTAGIDVLDSFKTIDVHLNRDINCSRGENELGLTGTYPDDPNSIFICVYLTEPDLQAGSLVPFTPEGTIHAGGQGVFAHEYLHAILWGRFSSSHDFIFPIEYVTLNPTDSHYRDLCDPLYQYNAPLTYQLCKEKGLTFDQLLQSLLEVDRLYQGGYGNLPHRQVGYNQYRAVLDALLGSDTLPVFQEAGYQKIFIEEGTVNYNLPYAKEPCTYRAAVVSDGAVPLGTILDENAPFEKTWQLKNTGTCTWDGVRLVFARGEAMSDVKQAPVTAARPGDTVEVSMKMTAPAQAGVQGGEWRLRSPDSLDFGPVVNLVIYARPGCSLPPQLSSFTVDPAAIGPGALSLLSWGQATNVDKLEILGLGEVDPNGDRLLVQPKETTAYTLQATCGSQTASAQVTLQVDPGLPPFTVTDVSASAEPAQFSGSCAGGVSIRFTGEFVASSPGVILYRWVSSDGNRNPEQVIIAEKAGSQSVSTSWQLSRNLSAWLGLEILAPQDSPVVQAPFTLTCAP